ncbi:cleavage and polyadenylation specificity factor subunit [Pseudozyma hubeiensis SY62]|uniref:Cleavage and polyadenylation specificity factor subunit n=1 Tax=Pseudozyma hubeiensis (strain SY62) TaxID=1305764 RepID=R9P6N4_PSEHS|nr:cleavage and polyadenylation specificity factor subunit [Pseudozyma hubeiensis SY62]GAC96999.1 cleavage and polyadenylation specificity factor subunit [Pseudozyma hubeiensis SY62]
MRARVVRSRRSYLLHGNASVEEQQLQRFAYSRAKIYRNTASLPNPQAQDVQHFALSLFIWSEGIVGDTAQDVLNQPRD